MCRQAESGQKMDREVTNICRKSSRPQDEENQDVAGVCWDCERVAQLKSCLISLAGGVSAGCLGSTIKLRTNR